MDTINTSIDTNSVDKKKKSIFTKCIIAFTSIFSLIGVGFALLIPTTYKSAKAVYYDDNDSLISLNANELNNYTFVNFAYYFTSNSSINVDNFTSYIVGLSSDYYLYSDNEFVLADDFDSYDFDDFASGESFGFVYYSDGISTSLRFSFEDFRFHLSAFNELNNASLEPNFTDFINIFTGDDYLSIKTAIELDIQSNQPYTPTNLLQDMITLIFGGVLGVATGIGGGLSDLTNALVIQSGAMSPFIAFVLIFGGLALAFGLSRWVVNLITSLGNRNR